MKIEFNKLVRDKIPEIIKQDGKKASLKILNEDEYKRELLVKIVEEAQEVLATKGQKDDLIKEIGDVLEVIDFIVKAFNLSKDEIDEVKEKRNKSRGGFSEKIFLEYTEDL